MADTNHITNPPAATWAEDTDIGRRLLSELKSVAVHCPACGNAAALGVYDLRDAVRAGVQTYADLTRALACVECLPSGTVALTFDPAWHHVAEPAACAS